MSPLVWKGIVKFDYMTTAEEDEKYLTTEEISILFMCKHDQITTPGMRITSLRIWDFIHKENFWKDFGLYPQGDKYFFGRMT